MHAPLARKHACRHTHTHTHANTHACVHASCTTAPTPPPAPAPPPPFNSSAWLEDEAPKGSGATSFNDWINRHKATRTLGAALARYNKEHGLPAPTQTLAGMAHKAPDAGLCALNPKP